MRERAQVERTDVSSDGARAGRARRASTSWATRARRPNAGASTSDGSSPLRRGGPRAHTARRGCAPVGCGSRPDLAANSRRDNTACAPCSTLHDLRHRIDADAAVVTGDTALEGFGGQELGPLVTDPGNLMLAECGQGRTPADRPSGGVGGSRSGTACEGKSMDGGRTGSGSVERSGVGPRRRRRIEVAGLRAGAHRRPSVGEGDRWSASVEEAARPGRGMATLGRATCAG